MKLFYFPGFCSLSPHIALREAGLKFDLVKTDVGTKKTEDGGDFLKINPRGQVPTLQLEDGQILTEGSAIVQYIADRNPAAGLAPAAGSMERYRLQEWLNYIASELHKAFSPLFNPATPDDYKKVVVDNIKKKLAYLDQHFAKNDYLLGKQFTVADAYAFTIINWSNFVNLDLSPYASIKAFMARVAARPKVQEALKAEGLAA